MLIFSYKLLCARRNNDLRELAHLRDLMGTNKVMKLINIGYSPRHSGETTLFLQCENSAKRQNNRREYLKSTQKSRS